MHNDVNLINIMLSPSVFISCNMPCYMWLYYFIHANMDWVIKIICKHTKSISMSGNIRIRKIKSFTYNGELVTLLFANSIRKRRTL